jgi:hypothetical protein
MKRKTMTPCKMCGRNEWGPWEMRDWIVDEGIYTGYGQRCPCGHARLKPVATGPKRQVAAYAVQVRDGHGYWEIIGRVEPLAHCTAVCRAWRAQGRKARVVCLVVVR